MEGNNTFQVYILQIRTITFVINRSILDQENMINLSPSFLIFTIIIDDNKII